MIQAKMKDMNQNKENIIINNNFQIYNFQIIIQKIFISIKDFAYSNEYNYMKNIKCAMHI